MTATDRALELVRAAAQAASDKLAENIIAFDVSDQLVITDAFVLCSAPNDRQVKAVVDQRCVLCHNTQVNQKNVMLHTPELIQQHALAVYQQVAVLKLMPLNNATQITDDERALIRRWYEAGAPASRRASSRSLKVGASQSCGSCRAVTWASTSAGRTRWLNCNAMITGLFARRVLRYHRAARSCTTGVVNANRYGAPRRLPAALVALASTFTVYLVA